MVSIRSNTFETNSSSQHCLTLACEVTLECYKDYLLKELERWKTENQKYDVHIKCDEDLLDDGDFTIRSYIPHYSFNDKAIYALATILQHYKNQIVDPPHKSYKFEYLPDDVQQKYYTEYNAWKEKWNESNEKIVKNFQSHIKQIEESIGFFIAVQLGILQDDVHFAFDYVITEDNCIQYGVGNNYFSTGCYGNEAFYQTLDSSFNGFAEWLCNPYSAVLAGSDEQSTLENMLQQKEAKRCLNAAYAHVDDYYTDVEEIIEDLESERNEENSTQINTLIEELKSEGKGFFPNSGCMIWPLGG